MNSILSKKWLFIAGVVMGLNAMAQAPVLTFSPLNGTTNVATSTTLTISFDRDMQIISGNTALTNTNVDDQVTLKLNNSAGADIDFDATISNGTKLITIVPDALLPAGATIYLAVTGLETLTSDGDDDMAPAVQSVTFQTDGTAPVKTFSPVNGAINVPIATPITISFSEAIRNTNDIDIDNTNVASLLTFKLGNSGGTVLTFTASINPGKTQITLVPDVALVTDQRYYVAIAAVEDASNNTANASSVMFKTTDTQPPVATFTPLNGATGVSETAPIIITLNERIRRASDDATFTDTNIDGRITLKLTDASGANIGFNATINDPLDSIITITPSAALPGNSIIYVALAGVEDFNNNAMTTDPASITFTTGDSQPPTITSTVPADEAGSVLISTNTLQITFNENVVFDGDNTDNANRIRIRNVTTSTWADTIALANVNVVGNVVTITFDAVLAPSTNYAIQIGNSVFKDGNNNFFTGISDNTTWDFDTEAGPNITSYSSDPTCMGESINIVGTSFGTAPTVTVNGISVTPSASTPTSITIIVPTTTAGNATVVVTNTINGLSDSDNNLTLKDAIAATRPMAVNPSTPAVNENFNIEVGSTQTGVNYTVREGGVGPFTNSTAGTGGTISFGPFDQNADGSFLYEVRATSGGCTQQTYSLTVNIAELSANAGLDYTICNGDSVTLGGTTANPTASGGTGYFSIKWFIPPSTVPFSTASNPQVKPTDNTVYRVVVADSPSNSDEDFVTVNVKERLSSDSLEIKLTPAKPNNVYSKLDDPVSLSFERDGNPGTFIGQTRFEGQAVNTTDKKFFPAAANLGPNEVNLIYENEFGCLTNKNITIDVSGNGDFVTGLLDNYCEENANITSIQMKQVYDAPTRYEIIFNNDPFCFFCFTIIIVDYKYTYQGSAQLIDAATAVPVGSGFSTSGPGNRNITLNTSLTGVGRKIIRAEYLVQRFENGNITPVSSENLILDVANFTVMAKPVLTFNMVDEVCENDDPIALSGKAEPIGGTYEVDGLGSSTFDPSASGLPNTTTITYFYEDPVSTCENTMDHDVIINRLPDINDILFDNGCVRDTIEMTPDFSNPGSVPFTYTWDVDGATGPDIFVNSTSETPIKRTYLIPSNYPISIEVTRAGTLDATKLCKTSFDKSLTIGQVPDLAMSWSNVCDGDATRFGFYSQYFKDNLANIDSVTWRFGDGTKLAKGAPGLLATDSIANRLYAATGYFLATVALRTDLNCIQTDTVTIYKVAKTGVIGVDEYFEDFNDAQFEDQEWKSGGSNSSWTWGAPTGTFISSDSPGGGKAWVTTNSSGVYNTSEASWVHSPCFNLTQIERPILSFDLRSLTREGIDGVVMQYNSKGTTNNKADWKTLGSVGSGKNWFNRIAIAANPGNQTLLQTGWTGAIDSTEWRTAMIPLDNILSGIPLAERSRVRIRFAFGSSVFVPEGEGFAFDNFKIAQRDRLVLLEQFTNNGGASSPTEPNRASNTAINNFITNSFGEVMKLEYHLGVSGPEEDPLHMDNPVESNARAAFYGVSTTPTTFVDARHGNLQNIYQEQTLKPSLVVIDSVFTTDTPESTMNIEVRFTPKTDLPENTVLHIAVIEKRIDLTAANGENSFKYVMKKMLPDALGTRFTAGLPADVTETVNVSWSPKAYKLDSLAVIAFVQNEETKEVYQTAYLKNPIVPDADMITGMEPTFAEQIIVFPNPAEGEVNIQLPGKARQAMPVNMIDGFGREVYNNQFKTGEQAKKINTSTFSGGVYILQIKAPNGEVARKKVMIVNK